MVLDSEQEDQDNEEAVLRKEVVRLRFLIKRMTGRDDSATFTDLQAISSRLEDVERIVDQKLKIIPPDEVEDDVLIPVLSSEQRREKLLLKIEREFERRKSESLKSEFDRLWILNERMNGREIESMSSYY